MINRFLKNKVQRAPDEIDILYDDYVTRVLADGGTVNGRSATIKYLLTFLQSVQLIWYISDDLTISFYNRVIADSGTFDGEGYIKPPLLSTELTEINWFIETETIALRDAYLARVVADSGENIGSGYRIREDLYPLEVATFDPEWLDSEATTLTYAYLARVSSDSGSIAATHVIRNVLTQLEETTIIWNL